MANSAFSKPFNIDVPPYNVYRPVEGGQVVAYTVPAYNDISGTLTSSVNTIVNKLAGYAGTHNEQIAAHAAQLFAPIVRKLSQLGA